MKAIEFLEQIKEVYADYFPNSKCFVKLSKNLYHSISITCCLASDNSELSGGYWENDMFRIRFSIDTIRRAFPKDMELDSELPEELRLECDNNSYTVVPENRYMAYGSNKVSFRKTVGSAEKLLKTLDRFFNKLYNQLNDDLENGQIHDNHIELLKEKLR